MNKLNYILKYAEYLIRKTRVFVTPDLYFHTAALNKISGSQADLINPVTLSEKICHRLVFDRNPFYTLLADKLAVRDYVHAKTRRVKTIPLIGVYHRVDDIDFREGANKFLI